MKKRGIVFLTVFAGFIFPLLAHPPSQINIQYDPVTQLMSLDIIHPTQDAENHHIKLVEITLNGKWIIKQEFSVQTESLKHQTAALLVLAKPGDKIDITAVCNVFGKKEVSYIIPEG